jgi:hypothetical protein
VKGRNTCENWWDCMTMKEILFTSSTQVFKKLIPVCNQIAC